MSLLVNIIRVVALLATPILSMLTCYPFPVVFSAKILSVHSTAVAFMFG